MRVRVGSSWCALGGKYLEKFTARFEAPLSFDRVQVTPTGGDVFIDIARYVLNPEVGEEYLMPASHLHGSPPPAETDVWEIIGEGKQKTEGYSMGYIGSCMRVSSVRRILSAYNLDPTGAKVVNLEPRRVLRVPRPTR